MSRKNKYYPPEFKREALQLYASGKYTMAQIERDLDISKGLLQKWKVLAERRGALNGSSLQAKTAEDAEARIRRLERDNERLRQEREILKKAMAIFSNPKV